MRLFRRGSWSRLVLYSLISLAFLILLLGLLILLGVGRESELPFVYQVN